MCSCEPLEGALADPPCGGVPGLRARRGSARPGWSAEVEARGPRAGFASCTGRASSSAARSSPFAPVVAALRDLPRRGSRSASTSSARGRAALAAVLPRETPERRRPGPRCSSSCSTCSAGSPPSAARCCSCSRTSTGPTARRASCSRSWPATCATSGSSCSPPTASTTSSRPRCAGSRRELGRRPHRAADRARAARRATTSPASSRRSPAARCRPRWPASSTPAPAATRSSSRSCSPRATRRRPGDGRRRRAAARRARSTARRALLAVLAAAGGRASHALLERARRRTPDALRAALDAGLLVRDAATASRSATG